MVWHRIAFARERNLKISETTITEQLIFDFQYEATRRPFAIEIFRAKSEQTNGNDLELFVETSNGYILYPCQAKIIGKRDKYHHLRYKSGANYQIDLLLKYAQKHSGVAGYLFYNYVKDEGTHRNLQTFPGQNESDYGISWCPAELIKERYFPSVLSKKTTIRSKLPHFNDLHPHDAVPFPEMVCSVLNAALDSLSGMQKMAEPLPNHIRFYTSDEIDKMGDWDALPKRASIGFIHPRNDLLGKVTRPIAHNSNSFQPAYRIVISQSPAPKGLFIIE